ncbi:hypothetical protein Tco_0470925 [Tanacetum coccineum]
MVSSIPIIGSISPEGFLSLILLLVVIIAMVVVTVVVVVAIVRVVIVVAVIGVVVVVAIVRVVIVVAVIGVVVVVACASRAVATLSATSFLMVVRVIAGASDVDVLLGGIYQHKITRNKSVYHCQNLHT